MRQIASTPDVILVQSNVGLAPMSSPIQLRCPLLPRGDQLTISNRLGPAPLRIGTLFQQRTLQKDLEQAGVISQGASLTQARSHIVEVLEVWSRWGRAPTNP